MSLERYGPGDHIVFVYENARELTTFAVPFIKDGLAKGERCVYVVDDLRWSDVIEALSAGGVHVDREIERGALLLLNAQEYDARPHFDALRVLEGIRERLTDARSRGFAGLIVDGRRERVTVLDEQRLAAIAQAA